MAPLPTICGIGYLVHLSEDIRIMHQICLKIPDSSSHSCLDFLVSCGGASHGIKVSSSAHGWL
jgi:hypothetical protein